MAGRQSTPLHRREVEVSLISLAEAYHESLASVTVIRRYE